MKRIIRLFCWLLISGVGATVLAQESEHRIEQNQLYINALDLFEKQEYTSAQRLFEQIKNQAPAGKENASVSFHYAVCSYHLQKSDALTLLTDYVENFPTTNEVNEARFLIGNEYFNRRKFKQALESYEKTNTLRLKNEEISPYFFNKGYCYLMLENEAAAQENFREIKNGKGEYAEKARFYSASLAYQQEQLAEARTDFESLKKSKEFSQKVNMYLVDIDHKTGRFEQVTQFDDRQLDGLAKKEKTAIVAMKADAWFQLGDYDQAQYYHDLYEQKLRGRMERVMQYQQGYILYRNKSYPAAIERFTKVVMEDDSLTQSAYYLQGLAQMKADKKRDAQRSFYAAYKMPYLPDVAEESMFCYVQLACDLAYDPYRETFSMLEQYIENHPDGKRIDDAYLLIVNLSLSTKNYAEALAALEKITRKTPEVQREEQKIRYLYAVNLMNAQKYQDAVHWFQKAAESDVDKSVAAEAIYWQSECYYRMEMLSLAETSYRDFYRMPAAKSLPFYHQTDYHLAYIQYDRKDYAAAAGRFEQFLKAKDQPVTMMQDAYLRLGDCYYVQKRYQDAVNQYDNALKTSTEAGDYAMFRKALCYGAMEQYHDKIAQLDQLRRKYPKSLLIREVIYESAMTHLASNQPQKALVDFNQVIDNYPFTLFAVKSKLRKGLILYGQDKNSEALVVLKDVVDHHPDTEESHEALKVIENIYLSMNGVDEYLNYVSTVPFADISNAEKDSLAYFAAENLYTQSNCFPAISSFQRYIEQFPNGIFVRQARNYLADCAIKTNQPDLALEQYEMMAQTPTETNKSAIEKAAAMRYERGDYQRAIQHYRSCKNLSSQTADMVAPTVGMMNCYDQLEQWDSLSMTAFELLSLPNVPKNKAVEAHRHIAKVALIEQNIPLAKREFQVVRSLGQGAEAAEAGYHLAEIQFHEQHLDEAMEMTFNLINDYPNEDYWVVSGFILLSDIYVAKENVFQAEQTLNSVIENCDIETLRHQATEKLEALQQQFPSENTENQEDE